MKKCRITVMRITRYEDLMARYENPIPLPCCCPPAGWTELDGVLAGEIDELRIYNRALPPEEVKALFNHVPQTGEAK